MPRSATPGLSRRAFTPVDGTFLGLFRILFGILNIVLVWLYHQHGMIRRYYIDPPQHFTYYGFDWVKPWPGDGMYWHYAGLAVLSALVAVGLFYRVAILLLALGLAHVFLIEQARYLNHYYLNVLVAGLLCVLPAHRSLSLDAHLRPAIRRSTAPAWALWILRFQVGIAYFFAGVAKFDSDWLNGLVLVRTLRMKTELPLVGSIFGTSWISPFMSVGGLLLDLLVVPLLLWKRTRVLAFTVAAAFHVTNAVLFRIDIFPWFMLGATYVLFFSDRLPFARRSRPDATPARFTPHRATIAVLALYVGIQTFLPLRHHLYAGNTNWTDRGHDFAWRMMLRAKTGYVRRVTTTYRDSSGVRVSKTIGIPEGPAFWARHWQFRKMAQTPDMILQFCHAQADALRRAGYTNVEIRADVLASLNGRPYQPLVDPEANLADASRSPFARWDWILPLTTPAPTLDELLLRLDRDDTTRGAVE